MNDKRVIILLVKYPQKGRVKTRLAQTLGDEAAVAVYQRLVEHLIRLLRRVTVDEICISFDPAEKHSEIEDWIRPMWQQAGVGRVSGVVLDKEPTLGFCSQCEGDLGVRLKSAFGTVFEENKQAEGAGVQVIAIGSDCIEIDEGTFRATWEALATKEVVFGPTLDGGYYLVGMNSPHPELFEDIPWSSKMTLRASLQGASEAGLETALLDEKHDIDTEQDWRRAETNCPF